MSDSSPPSPSAPPLQTSSTCSSASAVDSQQMAARGSHWSFLEKARFEAALHRYGPFAWRAIIRFVGTRSEKQVKAYAARYRRRKKLAQRAAIEALRESIQVHPSPENTSAVSVAPAPVPISAATTSSTSSAAPTILPDSAHTVPNLLLRPAPPIAFPRQVPASTTTSTRLSSTLDKTSRKSRTSVNSNVTPRSSVPPHPLPRSYCIEPCNITHRRSVDETNEDAKAAASQPTPPPKIEPTIGPTPFTDPRVCQDARVFQDALRDHVDFDKLAILSSYRESSPPKNLATDVGLQTQTTGCMSKQYEQDIRRAFREWDSRTQLDPSHATTCPSAYVNEGVLDDAAFFTDSNAPLAPPLPESGNDEFMGDRTGSFPGSDDLFFALP